MIILKNWYGRLGNNIVQLSNIIDIALFYEHEISFKCKHKLFDVTIIENYFKMYKNEEIINHPNFFGNGIEYIKKIPEDIYEKNNITKIKLLKQAFLIKDVKKLDENDVVVHIRSGDTITKEKPNFWYTPPPLSYYTTELNKKKYNKIIIVCEDNIHPVVDELLKLYKNAVWNENTLEQDIKLILGATNVITSVGWFAKQLLLISDNIKNEYHFNMEEHIKYKSVMFPWKNTEEQRQYIMSYKYD